MFKPDDQVEPSARTLILAGIDADNIDNIRVIWWYNFEEVDCMIYRVNGSFKRTTVHSAYLVLAPEKEEYSLTF